MKNKLLVLAMAAAVALFTVMPAMAADEAAPAAEEAGPYQVGDVAKDLQVTDAGGKTVDLAKTGSTDRKVIVFLNTACSACRTEMTVVQNIVAGKDVDLLVVATDMGPYDKVSAYKDSARFMGSWFQDSDFVTPTKFGFFFTPAMVVLDKGGKVLLSSGGYNKRKAKQFEDSLLAAIQ